MVRITHRPFQNEIAHGDPRKILLRGAETKLEVAWGAGSWAWSYCYPTQVSLEDDPRSAVALRDHVMLARVGLLLATALVMLKGR